MIPFIVFSHTGGIGRPNNLTEMVAIILIPSSSEDQVQFVFLVVDGKVHSIIVIVKPFLLNKVRTAYGVTTNDDIC